MRAALPLAQPIDALHRSAFLPAVVFIAEIEAPSASGRASARGMARVMAMLAGGGELDGVRVLSEAGRDNAIAKPVNSSTRNHEVRGHQRLRLSAR